MAQAARVTNNLTVHSPKQLDYVFTQLANCAGHKVFDIEFQVPVLKYWPR